MSETIKLWTNEQQVKLDNISKTPCHFHIRIERQQEGKHTDQNKVGSS